MRSVVCMHGAVEQPTGVARRALGRRGFTLQHGDAQAQTGQCLCGRRTRQARTHHHGVAAGDGGVGQAARHEAG